MSTHAVVEADAMVTMAAAVDAVATTVSAKVDAAATKMAADVDATKINEDSCSHT